MRRIICNPRPGYGRLVRAGRALVAMWLCLLVSAVGSPSAEVVTAYQFFRVIPNVRRGIAFANRYAFHGPEAERAAA